MIEVAIPGHGVLNLEYLLLDFNGTLAVDGELVSGVKKRLKALSKELDIHVVTADTFGGAKAQLKGLPVELAILPTDIAQDIAKAEYVNRLGAESTVCVGNGRNDHAMLKQAVLGIAVLLQEGVYVDTLMAADIVVSDVTDALDLLLRPLRLVATLRS
jgi:soluble P-type ATPase